MDILKYSKKKTHARTESFLYFMLNRYARMLLHYQEYVIFRIDSIPSIIIVIKFVKIKKTFSIPNSFPIFDSKIECNYFIINILGTKRPPNVPKDYHRIHGIHIGYIRNAIIKIRNLKVISLDVSFFNHRTSGERSRRVG